MGSTQERDSDQRVRESTRQSMTTREDKAKLVRELNPQKKGLESTHRVHQRVHQSPRVEEQEMLMHERTERLMYWKGGLRPCLEKKPNVESTQAGITLCFWRVWRKNTEASL